MTDAVFHPLTFASLERLSRQPPHGILLEAPKGHGKSFTALYLAGQLLNVSYDKVRQHPYFKIIDPVEGAITIEQVRELKQFVRLRVPGATGIARIVTIIDADRMTTEAQNAILKLLEEPPADTVLILTSSQTADLLSTVRSRAQLVCLQSPSSQDSLAYFTSKGFEESAIARAQLISNGRTGLMQALLSQDSEHPLLQAIESAKQLLASSKFERLCQVDTLAKQKSQLETLLEGFVCISQAALQQAGQSNNITQAQRWHQTLKHTLETQQLLVKNASSKLVLTDFFLSI